MADASQSAAAAVAVLVVVLAGGNKESLNRITATCNNNNTVKSNSSSPSPNRVEGERKTLDVDYKPVEQRLTIRALCTCRCTPKGFTTHQVLQEQQRH